MIKENDLRIGNLLISKKEDFLSGYKIGEPFKVHSIDWEGVNISGNYEPGGMEPDLKWEEVEGIPIAEEWFVNLSFNRGALDSNCIYYHKKINVRGYEEDICIRYYRDGYFMYCNGNECNSSYKTHRFVHDLQNLIYALTGEELTIK